MSDRYVLRVYNGKGDLWHRETAQTDADLRDVGARFTTVRGQLSWRADLFKNGTRVESCKRGVWKAVRP